jgi:hypothetical protein
MITITCLLLYFKNIFEKQYFLFFICIKLFFIFSNYFYVLILKINLKNKKYIILIYFKKILLNKNNISNNHKIKFLLKE